MLSDTTLAAVVPIRRCTTDEIYEYYSTPAYVMIFMSMHTYVEKEVNILQCPMPR